MAQILDPEEASSGSKLRLTYLNLVLITGGAVFATFNTAFAAIYFSYGQLLLGMAGLYFTGSVIHKISAGVVNGKYATTSDEVSVDEDEPTPTPGVKR